MKVVNIPIEVLAWYKLDGDVIPLNIQLSDENQELKVIKINRVIKVDKEKFSGKDVRKYTCQITLNGIERLIELWCTTASSYENPACKWKLHKL